MHIHLTIPEARLTRARQSSGGAPRKRWIAWARSSARRTSALARSRRVKQARPTLAHRAAMPVSAAADAHGAEPDEDVEVAIVS